MRIVMVARFEPQKDHRTLLEAFAPLENAHLDLVGSGPGEESVRALVAERGLADRVRFLGHRADVAEVLACSHVFALISNWEGFPRSTLEAMRAGLPTVVSAVGGAAEAIVEGSTGYVVPRGDAVTLRARLSLLAGDPTLRAQLGQAARRRYEDYFTFERMYRDTLAVYHVAVASSKTVRDGERTV
jgi:glycosyltransferase involved in cell wall biosynthesis